MLLAKYIRSFFELIYPSNCRTCGVNLVVSEELLCTNCLYELPRSGFHKSPEENPVAELFYGLVPVKYATAFYLFGKGSKYRSLIHGLKYKRSPEIGISMGKYFGAEIKSSAFAEADLIVPVPLHPAKKRIRGYNQSEMIGRGMEITSGIKQNYDNLIRKVFTETQTKKTLEERRENVASVFAVRKPVLFQGKHILLVDDVVTTGSTLVACAEEILKIPDTQVSIATLAVAKQ